MSPTTREVALGGAIVGLAAVPVALVLAAVNTAYTTDPSGTFIVRAIVLAAMISVLAAAVLLVPRMTDAFAASRRDESMAMSHAPVNALSVALAVLAALLSVMAGIRIYSAFSTAIFPADILIWSESDFVSDILKLRTGHPLFTGQENNESFTYTPGAQIVTWVIATALGQPLSIPAYRLIQLGFTIVAACVGLACVLRIARLAGPGERISQQVTWGMIWFAAILLAATNDLTNGFVVNLHNDALAQLVSLVAFALLLRYVDRPSRGLLFSMALVPAAGFLVKQSLAIWGPLYLLHLLVFDSNRSWRRAATFTITSAAALVLVVVAGRAIWGEAFSYWTIDVLGARGVSPRRSLEHLLESWTFLAAGLFAGVVLLRGESGRRLLGPWSVWLTFFCVEAYTSGTAWMLNHIGPASTIAVVLASAAVLKVWARLGSHAGDRLESRVQAATAAALGSLLLVAGPLSPEATPPLPPDAWRYVREIEEEFGRAPPQRVLLDAGSWVYQKHGIIMKDRAAAIGERGYSATGDFSGVIARINARAYDRILVRNLHSDDFWYDQASWERPSGIRAALVRNYTEVRTIEEANVGGRYLFSAVSVLVPRQ